MFPYQRPKRPQAKLEFTPLIDIVFILLIFFAVSTTLITNKLGIKLDLPEADSSTQHEKGIRISINDKKQLFFEERKISINDISLKVKSSLTDNPKTYFILNADKKTPYEEVIKVMDQIRLGGSSDIVLEVTKIKKG